MTSALPASPEALTDLAAPNPPKPLLSIKNLSLQFRTRSGIVQGLRSVSLDLQKGETLGLVGESGSGKSVLSFATMRISDPAAKVTEGSINFDGMSLLDLSESAMQNIRGREMAMVFQNPRVALNPIRKVGLQIKDVLRRHAAVPAAQLQQRAIALLQQVRIPDPESRYHAYPAQMSGGQCQRVMIAIALACNPALLIADEPTTGLDVTTQAAIMGLIRELARDRRMATILITHDLALASQNCERIAVMRHGQIVELAPVEALFSNPQHEYTRALIAAIPASAAKASPRPIQPPELGHESPLRDEASSATPVQPPDKPITAQSSLPGTLEVHRVVRRFSVGRKAWFGALTQLHAVDDVSFEIKPGQSLGLVGESGCGKSTMARLVARLIDTSDGRLVFSGTDIGAIPAAKFARAASRTDIQMVFQDPTDSLNPRYTAYDCIAEPLRLLAGLRDDAVVRVRVGQAASDVGLPEELLSRFPHQLSGGQKARVGIARAVCMRPKLLVLDEPTAALDVSVQAVVLRLLAELKVKLNMSYLFISHDLNVVRILCDQVLVMYLGKVVEAGVAQEVFDHPAHPYTRALVNAIPKIEFPAVPWQGDTGEPQSPIDPDPKRCRYAGRCANEKARCLDNYPSLQWVHSQSRQVACHFPLL